MDILTSYANDERKAEYVKECEKHFTDEVNECSNKLVAEKSLKFVTLSGPTCSGKTTAARILTEAMESCGKRVSVISIDDFYYGIDILTQSGKQDFDSVSTIDLELLESVIKGINNKMPVQIPVYSFLTRTRTGFRECIPGDVTIFEGIQAIYPEVRRLFDKNEMRSIYISVGSDVRINGRNVSARTVRLFRRIVRDYRTRSAKPEFTLKIWEGVVENEDKSIIPHKGGCDYFIDSLMGYEISVIKEQLIELLDEIDDSSEYAGYANELKKIFEGVETLPERFIPQNSLYREFIG